MTPGEYKELGSGLIVRYGFHPSPFGECLIFLTEKGVCGLAFVESDREAALPGSRRPMVLGHAST